MLIGNDCTAGLIYNLKKAEYDNPFLFGYMDKYAFKDFVKNFDAISKENFKVGLTYFKKQKCCSVSFFEGNNTIFYHYRKNDDLIVKSVKVNGSTNKYGKYICRYLSNRIKERFSKMNGDVSFLLNERLDGDWTVNDINELRKIVESQNRKLYIVTFSSYDVLKPLENDNFIVLRKPYIENIKRYVNDIEKEINL